MNFQEFREVFSQIATGRGKTGGVWLTPLYSSSSLYSLSESPDSVPSYIPVSTFQRVFVSMRRLEVPAGFYQCRISGSEMIRYVEMLQSRGYAIYGYEINGRGGRHLKTEGFQNLSGLISDELGRDPSLTAESITMRKKEAAVIFDSHLQIFLSGSYADLEVIFEMIRMHENFALAMRELYDELSSLRVSGDVNPAKGIISGTEPEKEAYLPGYDIAIKKTVIMDTDTFQIHDRSNPLNWIRVLRTADSFRVMRGPYCSFDFFSAFAQNLGGVRN